MGANGGKEAAGPYTGVHGRKICRCRFLWHPPGLRSIPSYLPGKSAPLLPLLLLLLLESTRDAPLGLMAPIATAVNGLAPPDRRAHSRHPVSS